MRTALIVIYFVGILHVSRTIALQLQFTPDLPVLSTAEEVYRINSSDSLELKCRGQQHVEWSTPQDPSDGRLLLTDCSGSGLFCSSLTIHKAVANDTSLYRCYYRDLPVEDGKTSTSVYVFVQDYNIPLIPTTHNIDVVFIRTGESVVIPCLGSIENLNVTLHMKFPPKQLLPDGKEVFWNSRKGFIVPSHLISGAGLVFCQTQIHNETFQSSLYILTVVGYMIYQLMLTPTQQRLLVGERLVLNCTAHTELNVGIDFRWTFPAGQDLAQPEIRPHKKRMTSSLELSNMLILENVTLNHTGQYTCSAYSGQMVKNSTASVVVYEKPFIVLSDDGPSAIEVTVGERLVKIPVKYDAYPPPNVIWLKNGQPALKDEMKYRMRQEKDALIISDVAERDAGNYTVILRNLAAKEQRMVQLLVNVPPQIYEKEVAEDNDIHIYGSSPILRCTARGHPSPVRFSWQWMPQEDCPHNFLSEGWRSSCNKWRNITNNTGQNPTESPNTITDQFNKTISSLRIQRAEVHALYRCEASNKVGRDQRVIFFHVTRGLALDTLPSSEPIEHDSVALRCKADKLIYGNLRWFWLGRNMTLTKPLLPAQSCRTLALPPQPMSQAVLSDLEGTNVTLELRFPNVSQHHQGLYVCQVVNIKTKEKTCLVRALTLKALQASKIMVGPSEQRVNASDTASLTCQVTGTPMPTIVWTKNNQTLVQGSGVILTQGNQTLTIQRVKKEDSGLYTCTACNAQGCDASHASLMVEGVEEKTTVELIVPIGSVVIAMFFWLLIVFVVRNRKRPRDSELKTGYLSIILDSEDMPVEEQCERLTYDPSKWEFPRDRLKLGEPLGRGAFGQVVEAAAFGMEKAATCTTVAVKMLKEGATSSEYRALMSELKILIHIGHHLNVVNLLGACTKPGGPLMVIVEYCKYGNLSSYLKSKRSVFIPFKRNPLMSPVDEDLTRGDLGFGMYPPRERAVYSAYQNDVIVCHQGEEGRGDVNRSHLSTEDLISYSFQVAKGMEFLSSRKCIHRDLAARNILLSGNNVVKICDFGLARDVYKDPDYVRKGDARLPLKWMAPETIFDRVYTTQSDVWSFGVLLWEIFSLGASPYPGVPIDEAFCQRLKDGTRMRAPEYASPEIYQIMLGCWMDQAKERPTFPELVLHLGDLLQASAKQDGKDYIPLTPGRLEGTSGALLPVPPQPCELQPGASEPLNHYDNAPYFRETHFRFSQKSDRCSQPISRRTFEAVPLEQSVITNAQLDIGMSLSPEDAKSLDHPVSQTPTFSPLIRCKSKESLGSESSNPTSGYQSGYHSDDADVPIYANEEIILKTQGQAKAPLRACVKFTTEVRYSAPPV